MVKRDSKTQLTLFGAFDFVDELKGSMPGSPFKKALNRYFEEKGRSRSQAELQKELNHIRIVLKGMDEVKVAHKVMEKTRRRLHVAYQELLEKYN